MQPEGLVHLRHLRQAFGLDLTSPFLSLLHRLHAYPHCIAGISSSFVLLCAHALSLLVLPEPSLIQLCSDRKTLYCSFPHCIFLHDHSFLTDQVDGRFSSGCSIEDRDLDFCHTTVP